MEVSSIAQLKEAAAKDALVVVLCQADWSEPCKQMSTVVQELSVMHSAIDVENVPAVQQDYNIHAVPHVLFFKVGEVVDRAEGADPQALLQKLEIFSADAPSTEPSLDDRIAQLVASADVMLFMKGSPDAPRCGFSSRVVDALNDAHIRFSHFDILQDDAIRQGLKAYNCWPTYPQLYVKGEFVGGCDIVTELSEKQTLQKEILERTGGGVVDETPTQKCERLTKQAAVVLFMKGSPDVPRCKFSRRVVAALNETALPFEHFDVLQDEALRQELKSYAQWPTYPQLYVHGKFVGGCDIVEELQSKGELTTHLTSLLNS